MMNKILKIVFVISFLCSCSLNAKDQDLGIDIKSVKETNAQNAEKHFLLLRQAALKLEKNWDDKFARDFAQAYSEVSKHDQNSYVLQTFGELLKKKEDQVKKLFKENLSKDEYELFESNLLMHKREISKGNG